MRSMAASLLETCAVRASRCAEMRADSARTRFASSPSLTSEWFAAEMARSDARSASRASRCEPSFFSSSRLSASMRPRSALRFSSWLAP
jgi:hypothetical protein